jgi:hypothetical protein
MVTKEILFHRVNVHQIMNPPATRRNTHAIINFINLRHLQISDYRHDKECQSYFTLKIIDPKEIGLESSEQTHLEKFINNILLGCNLILKRSAFSKQTFDTSATKIEFQDNNVDLDSKVTKNLEVLEQK